ncbi:MAG: sulfotransferase [Magnetococcales bacterium]|nr:sulfotransferase [Magnetococcales bacterium]
MAPLPPDDTAVTPQEPLTMEHAWAMAVDHFIQNRLQEADQLCGAILATDPRQADALNMQGVIAQRLERPDLAVPRFQSAIAITDQRGDDSTPMRDNLVISLFDWAVRATEQGHVELAEQHYLTLLEIEPEHVESLVKLGNIIKDQGRLTEAIARFRQALALRPDLPVIHNNLGNALKELGDIEGARKSLNQALILKPDYAQAHFNRALVHRCRNQAELKILQNLLPQAETRDEQVHLHFALGKALVDLKRHREAFPHYLEANRLYRAGIDFDMEREVQVFQHFRALYEATTSMPENQETETGHADETPIFILGMPRSGSSLIEQILASHPAVHGAGELNILGRVLDAHTPSPGYTSAQLREMGQSYTTQLRLHAPNARRIIDKMPHNFMFIGLIRMMLPKATIIHSARSPLDTGLSIFRTFFTTGHHYGYDLTELGRYFHLFHEMMAYWERVIPGTVYNAHYEDLTGNQEEETRKLLGHCALEWDAHCLDFHTTKRVVTTASAMQVRRPIHRNSVAGWRRYEQALQPLVAALGDLVKS